MTSNRKQKIADLLRILFVFKGRIGREKCALACLGLLPLKSFLFLILPAMGNGFFVSILAVVFGVMVIAVVWALLAVFVKRLHDFNFAWGWVVGAVALCSLVPVALILVVGLLFLMPGDVAENRYGTVPVSWQKTVASWKVEYLGKQYAAGKMNIDDFNTARARALAGIQDVSTDKS